MASTYEPIATTTLGSAASSVTFSSISGSYTDLIVVVEARANSTVGGYVQLQMGNGSADTGANYSCTYLKGDGTSAASLRDTNVNQIFCNVNGSAFNSTTNSINTIIHINNYSNTTTYKTTLSRFNSAYGQLTAVAGLWRSTSAVNVVKILNTNDSFASGSNFTIYGIKAA